MPAMNAFTHDTRPQRLLVGAGRANDYLATEWSRLGASRLALIGNSHGEIACPAAPVLHIERVRQHVPAADVDSVRAAAGRAGVDIVVAVGGGSAIGLAKALALEGGIPIVAVPTTFSGSEATPIWGIVDSGIKRTGTDDRVLPRSVIYDASLVSSLPSTIAIFSGLNAFAHAVDALWAPRADPLSAAHGEAGMRMIATGLRCIVSGNASLNVWQETLLGGYLAASALASAGSGLHHKICHVLGGRYNLGHARLHAALLPYVIAFNASEAPQAVAVIARALDGSDALAAVLELYRDLQVMESLASLGLASSEIDESTRLCLPAIPASNPRPVDGPALRELIASAWRGSLTGDRRGAASVPR